MVASAGFFCAQAWAPDEEYLNGLHAFLSANEYGQLLLREISDLKTSGVWSKFATARDDVASLSPGPQYLDVLYNWASHGDSGPLAAARSGVVALPLLVILQVGQYLRYLQAHQLSHQTFLEHFSAGGGLQGFCGGLATAVALACAPDEARVIQYAATAMRVLVGVGAYAEAADDTKGRGSTTLAVRLRYEGQGEELTQCFPGTYVSAITEPQSISIVGPASILHELSVYAQEQEQLQVQKMDIRGKTHNPENSELADELYAICDQAPDLQLPDASELRVPVRSNRSGHKLTEGPLTKELVTTILAARCDWYTVLTETAKDLKTSGCDTPHVVTFGLADVVSIAPFAKQGVRLAKTAAHPLISRVATSIPKHTLELLPEDAIAVIGASCRLPGANNLDELWKLLASGQDTHRPLGKDRFNIYDSFRASQSKSFEGHELKFYGNFIDDVQRFDNAFFGVNPREAASMDPQQRLLLEVAYEALDDAGYLAHHRRENGDNVGCFIGGSLVEYLDNTSAHAPTAYVASGTIRAFLCGRLSYYFGWSGPAEVIDTACSSSLVAINRACKAIQAGECPMALCGGVNIITGMNNYFDLGKAGFLSPTGQCKPFDVSADGYCRSDGVGLVVLKKLSDALADGDMVMGVIPGISTNQGGLSSSITIPHSTAQMALYRKVLEQAQVPPEKVTYIEAHGTGTQAGDPLEMESLRSVFGRRDKLPLSSDQTLWVGSIKGNLGHCETAAGVVGLLKVLTMIKHGQLPPQASHTTLNPKIGPLGPDGLAINRELRDWDTPFRAALVNSYGAAGSNCALLCCEMPNPNKSEDGGAALKMDVANVRLPLLISAASERGLLRYAQALSAHLRKYGDQLNLGDVAYTLNERRKHHKFLATIEAVDVHDAAGQLENLGADAIIKQNTSPQSAKPVVLVFSGQFDNKVGLDRAFYDQVPAFRHHLDLCDKELVAQGFPSIIPSIFDGEKPAPDATLLQCGIFAMQYASAQCWIDAGLEPSAVVGHSLGELTALAVCNVLSLADAIKLVASRARLIDTKWGPDKGSMMVLSNCTTADFQALRLSLQNQQPGSVVVDIDIACYNAADTIVVSGTSSDIAQLQRLASSEPRFQRIRTRPLATSHGFHSDLTEPLLADLAALSQSLDWKEPRFALETCTSHSSIESFKHYDPSKHLREPVFFVDAVERIEQRFPSAMWLEAGIGTPAVAMARAASGHVDTQTFSGVKASGARNALDSLAGVVSDLWKNGHVRLRHWLFLSPGEASGGRSAFKPTWLPPYQFEPTQHWVPNIDRVMEMRQIVAREAVESMALVKAPDTSSSPVPPSPQTLVRSTPRQSSSKTNGQVEFTINVQAQRFSKIVRGHALRSRPLCPASLYMEAVTMALQHLAADDGNSPPVFLRETSNLEWEEINFQNPLGTEPNGEVVVRLNRTESNKTWKFAICTLSGNSDSFSPRAREILHVSGVVSLAERLHLDVWERLVSGSVEKIMSSYDSERLMSKRAYGLFSRLVDYAPFFQGIHSLTLQDREAVATIRMPEDQPAREESTAWGICDAITIDAFIQVLGFAINTTDSSRDGEVAVMTGLDRAVISAKCGFSTASSASANRGNWRVYARFGLGGTGQPIGDAFVWNTWDNELVAVLTGCRFSKVPIVNLERSLDHAMQRLTTTPAVVRADPVANHHPLPAPSGSSSTSTSTSTSGLGTNSEAETRDNAPTPISSVSSTVGPPAPLGDKVNKLRAMIAESTGMDKSEITNDMFLADMGLDSLAAVDLAGELSSTFKLTIASHDLQNMTFGELSTKLGAGSFVAPPPSQHPPQPVSVVPPPSKAVPLATGVVPGRDIFQELKQVLVDVVCVERDEIEWGSVLADLGIDSMSANDLRQELQERFAMRVEPIQTYHTVEDLMKQLGSSAALPGTSLAAQSNNDMMTTTLPTHGAEENKHMHHSSGAARATTVLLGNPFDSLRASDAYFDDSAKKQGYFNHSQEAAPYEDEILLAHIFEGLAKLGVDVEGAPPNSLLPPIPHLKPKYDRLVPRLWEILQTHGYVTINNRDGTVTRTDRRADRQSSAAELLAAFRARFPAYQYESNIIGLTGPRLADCLSGKLDSVNLLFGNPTALKIVANFYDLSPMMSTLTDQLVHFLRILLLQKNVDRSRPVKILEVGAGTGGTTRRVLAALAAANIPTIYTFTDIAASLVSKAKTALKEYDFIEYGTFNLEKEVPEDYRNRFDIVISTNCVHATTNRTNSCRRLRDTLVPGGILVLSELTRKIDWYDTCFGLLDGWWLAEGRTIYPIQPADAWMSVYETAGFASYGCSGGPTPEATSQQLLVACKDEHWTVPPVQDGAC